MPPVSPLRRSLPPVNILSLFSLPFLLDGKRLGHEVVVGDQDHDEADGEEVLFFWFLERDK